MYRSILVTLISALYSKITLYLYSLFAARYGSVSTIVEMNITYSQRGNMPISIRRYVWHTLYS